MRYNGEWIQIITLQSNRILLYKEQVERDGSDMIALKALIIQNSNMTEIDIDFFSSERELVDFCSQVDSYWVTIIDSILGNIKGYIN